MKKLLFFIFCLGGAAFWSERFFSTRDLEPLTMEELTENPESKAELTASLKTYNRKFASEGDAFPAMPDRGLASGQDSSSSEEDEETPEQDSIAIETCLKAHHLSLSEQDLCGNAVADSDDLSPEEKADYFENILNTVNCTSEEGEQRKACLYLLIESTTNWLAFKDPSIEVLRAKIEAVTAQSKNPQGMSQAIWARTAYPSLEDFLEANPPGKSADNEEPAGE